MTEKSLENLVKNLVNFAPNKGQAKKSVSRGLIRLHFTTFGPEKIRMYGLATDDVVSIHEGVNIPIDDVRELLSPLQFKELLLHDYTAYFLPESLRDLHLIPAHSYERSWDEKFWMEHVMSSIHDNAPNIP